MERLTFEGNFCDIAQCEFIPGGSFCEDGACSQRKVWERLKAYEDTGLTPEEFVAYWVFIVDLVGNQKASEALSHFRALAEADKDGRVVVLPCKVNGAMLNISYPDKPRLMERVHFAVAYVSSGIVFHQPYNIFLENIAAGYIKPVDEEATRNE